MNWRLEVARAFDADLVAIERYLTEQASVSIARRQITDIRQKIQSIAENPLAYVQRPLLGEGIRAAIAQPYVLIFRCRGDAVRLLRVVHGARDLPSLRL